MRKWLSSIAVGVFVALILNAQFLMGQTRIYKIGTLLYTLPVSHANAALTNNGSGTLSWSVDLPTDLIAYTTSGTCPGGWAEETTLRGRYVVGLVSGGTNGATVGTALTNTENRATGQHNHTGSTSITLTNPTHTHGITEPSGGTGHAHPSTKATPDGSEINSGSGGDLLTNMTSTIGSASTGVTINSGTTGLGVQSQGLSTGNSGAITGTNAPYIQLLACKKS